MNNCFLNIIPVPILVVFLIVVVIFVAAAAAAAGIAAAVVVIMLQLVIVSALMQGIFGTCPGYMYREYIAFSLMPVPGSVCR